VRRSTSGVVLGGVLVCLVARPGRARAEAEPGQVLTIGEVMPVRLDAHGRSFSQQVADQLTALGAEFDRHLATLSRSTLGLRIDGRRRRARVHVVAGDHATFGLTVDGDIQFRAGAAEVAARLDLTLGGRQLSLDVPRLDLVPRSWDGERYLEVRLPLLRGTF